MLWLRKSLDCLLEKADKICTSSYHQRFISSIELGIYLALVKPQITPWEAGGRGKKSERKEQITKKNKVKLNGGL